MTSRALNTVPNSPIIAHGQSPSTKKERKAAKKAKKLSSMPKSSITSSEIQFVADILDPQTLDAEDADLERQLLEDPDIKLNTAFHPGTSNRREIRNEFVVKDKRATRKDDLHVDPDELVGILQLLNVSPPPTSSVEEKAIHEKLRGCIEHHLINVHNETEALMMRKAGFWRWASKKAYKRLVSNGRIRSQKSGSSSSGTGTGGPQSAASSVDVDEETESDTDVTTPEDEDGEIERKLAEMAIDDEPMVSYSLGSKPSNTISIDPSREEDIDEGWTTVGKPKAIKEPAGTIILMHNGGLTNMTSPVTPTPRRRGFVTSYDHLY